MMTCSVSSQTTKCFYLMHSQCLRSSSFKHTYSTEAIIHFLALAVCLGDALDETMQKIV